MANTQLCLPESYLEEMEHLTDEEFGHLIRELFRYRLSSGEEKVVGIGNGKFYAKRVMIQEDRNNEAYKDRCESNRINGKKGGRPKKADSALEEAETQKPNGLCEETQKPNGLCEEPKNLIKINKSKENINNPKEIRNRTLAPDPTPKAVGAKAPTSARSAQYARAREEATVEEDKVDVANETAEVPEENLIESQTAMFYNIMKNHTDISNDLHAALESWFRDKAERGQPYKFGAMKGTIESAINNANSFGDRYVIGVIEICLENGYNRLSFENFT